MQENAQSLADAGGVLALVSMMNDIDEDEISKKAFTTLTSMGEIAIDVVLGHIAALSIGVTGCVGLGEGLAAAEGAATPSSEIVEAVQAVASCAKDYYVEVSEETLRRRRDAMEREESMEGRSGGGGGGGEEASKASEWDVADAGMSEGLVVSQVEGGGVSEGGGTNSDGSGPTNGDSGGGGGNGGGGGGMGGGGGGGGEDVGMSGMAAVDRSHMSIVWGMLAKLLPVLNGMVYSDASVREYVWRHGAGMAVLLHVVTRALPLELRVVTVFTLANLTQSHNEILQQDAGSLDAVGVLAALMYEVQRNDLSDSDDDDDGGRRRGGRQHRRPVSARRSETFCVILQVVHNLVQSCPENVSRLVFMPSMSASHVPVSSPTRGGGTGQSTLLSFITRCCVDGTEPDLRNEAAGVLLSVVEVAIEEGGGPMLRRMLYGVAGPSGEHRTNGEYGSGDGGDDRSEGNVLSTLKLLSESFDSDLTSALKGRSQQSVRELEELQASGGGASQKK